MQSNCEECGRITTFIAQDGYFFMCPTHGAARSASEVPEKTLTPRQLQIACFIAEGYTNREIADELGLSHSYIRNTASAVIRQLKVSNRHRVAQVLRRWNLP